MKNYKILVITLLWLISQQSSWAQGKFLKAFASPLPSEKAIEVKWIGYTPADIQFHVLRRAQGEKTFTRLTQTTIKPVTAAGQSSPSTSLGNYLQFRKSTPKNAADGKFFSQLYSMNAYTDNDFAKAAGMYFKDNTVVAGKSYQYAINGLYKGEEYSLYLSEFVTAGDYKPLAAPINVTLKQQKTKNITLSWNLRPDVMAYDVYRRAGNGGEVKLNKKPVVVIDAVDGKRPSIQFSDTDSTLRVGETYYYRVAALSPFTIPGEKSAPVWLTLKDMDLPMAATHLSGRLVRKQVRLSWRNSTSPDLAGYKVFRSTAIDKPFTNIAPRLLAPSDTTFTDATATEGGTYYYYIQAEDKAGNSVNTPPVQVGFADLTPPAKPERATFKTDTLGHVSINWQANQEADLKGYLVYRALENTDDNYAQLFVKPKTNTLFLDTLPRTNRNRFYYRIVAIDKNDNESEPAVVTVRLPDVQPPKAPVLMPVLSEADSVRLVWRPSVSEDVASYQVFRRNETDRQPAFAAVGRTTNTRFTDTKVPSGQYSYAIVAIDSAGKQSAQSAPMIADVAGLYSLTAPNDIKTRVNDRDKTVSVTWSAMPQPANFRGYRVLARLEGGSFNVVTPFLSEGAAQLRSLLPDSKYELKVIAVADNGEQKQSPIISVKTPN